MSTPPATPPATATPPDTKPNTTTTPTASPPKADTGSTTTTPPTNNANKNTLQMAKALEILAEEGERRRTFSPGWFATIMTNINLLIAFGFDTLLFYTIDPRHPIPATTSFFVKVLLIIVSYLVINLVLGLFVYSALLPAYKTFYTAKFSSFAAYLQKQYNRYQNDSNRRILVRAGDPTTIGVLAFYPSIVDLSGSTINTMSAYKVFLYDKITATAPPLPSSPLAMNAMQKPLSDFYTKFPKLDSATVESIKAYYRSLPDQFDRYATSQQQYLYQAIQFWVLMLCTILFVIPIKYTFVDIVTPPKLPKASDIPGASALGKMGAALGAAATKLGNKAMGTGSAKVAPETGAAPPATPAAAPPAA